MQIHTIHFICRGNAFRSIIAQAYFNSKKIEGVSTYSSGSAAAQYFEENSQTFKDVCTMLKEKNILQYAKNHYGDSLGNDSLRNADLTIFINQRVFDEARKIGELPERYEVWSIADIGEPGRNIDVSDNYSKYMHQAFEEICKEVDTLSKRYKFLEE